MIYNKYIQKNNIYEKISIVVDSLKKIISPKNIIFMILSFVMVQINILGEFSPFSVVLFGVASFLNIPLLLVLIASILGILCSTVTSVVILKLFVFFTLFIFITAFINVEGVSEKTGVYIKLIISTLIVELLFAFLNGQVIMNFFIIITNLLLISIFYYIYVDGIKTLIDIGKSYINSKEEKIAMILVVAIALTIIYKFSIFGFSIFNILTFALILIYGWKNGFVLGSITSLITALILSLIIPNLSNTYIISLVVCGIVSGLLSKVGRISVIILFIIGNIYAIKYPRLLPLNINEILIALTSLMFIQGVYKVKIEKIFDKNKTLPNPYNNILGAAKDIRKRNDYDEISKIKLEYTIEEKKENREIIKKYILEYFFVNCIDCKTKNNCEKNPNIDLMVDYIANKLEKNEILENSALKLNCDKKKEEKILDDIYDIFISMKLIRVLKEKEKEDSSSLVKKYKELSKIISSENKINYKKTTNKQQEKIRQELKFYGYKIYEDEYLEEEYLEYVFTTDILTNINTQKTEILNIITNIYQKEFTIDSIINSSKNEKSKIKLISKQ